MDSTNAVESTIEIVRDHARRMKRWPSGEMALRWATAGMHVAESQLRRVKGYRELPSSPTPSATSPPTPKFARP